MNHPDSDVISPRRVAPVRGLEWITAGWAPFAANPGQWIALTLLWLAVITICHALPVLGSLVAPFVSSVFAAGTLLAAKRARDQGSTTLLSDVFTIASHAALQPVLIVAGIYLGMTLVVMLVFVSIMATIGGLSLLAGFTHMAPGALTGGAFGVLLALLALLAAIVPITAMYWYAIPDVVLRGAEPWVAMRRSLGACIDNIVPLLVYGVLLLIVFTIAMIPFGLGLLIAVPVLLNSWLISYEDIYTGTA